jgi:hypothetical protein
LTPSRLACLIRQRASYCHTIQATDLRSLDRSGRSPHWIKIKNPKAPTVTREAEENLGRNRDYRRPYAAGNGLTGHLRPQLAWRLSRLQNVTLNGRTAKLSRCAGTGGPASVDTNDRHTFRRCSCCRVTQTQCRDRHGSSSANLPLARLFPTPRRHRRRGRKSALDLWREAGEGVDNREHPQLRSSRQLIMHEVHRPDLIRRMQ